MKTEGLTITAESQKETQFRVELRDYFAASAILAATMMEEKAPCSAEGPTYKAIAARAHLIADAMLAERANGGAS
jgi:hypothetical protein